MSHLCIQSKQSDIVRFRGGNKCFQLGLAPVLFLMALFFGANAHADIGSAWPDTVTHSSIYINWSYGSKYSPKDDQPFKICAKEAGDWEGACDGGRVERSNDGGFNLTGLKANKEYKIKVFCFCKYKGKNAKWRKVGDTKVTTNSAPTEPPSAALEIESVGKTNITVKYFVPAGFNTKRIRICYFKANKVWLKSHCQDSLATNTDDIGVQEYRSNDNNHEYRGTVNFSGLTRGHDYKILLSSAENDELVMIKLGTKAARVGNFQVVSNDYDGDYKTDKSVWRGTTGQWFLNFSSGIASTGAPFGTPSSDVAVPGDYDGDYKTDLAVWKPSTGLWTVLQSSTGTRKTQNWGSQSVGDIPVPADYDGDGQTDFAVWRKTTGQWFIIRSFNGSSYGPPFGNAALGDIPVPGDYDGDEKTDLAVWRPSTGVWSVLNSSTGTVSTQILGNKALGDIAVPADYDGDGKTDFAIWRKSTSQWLIINSASNQLSDITFGNGVLNDIPVPGDYDGDGKTDIAVWIQSTGYWSVLNSSTGTTSSSQWGSKSVGDIPLPSVYIRSSTIAN